MLMQLVLAEDSGFEMMCGITMIPSIIVDCGGGYSVQSSADKRAE